MWIDIERDLVAAVFTQMPLSQSREFIDDIARLIGAIFSVESKNQAARE